MKLGGKLWVLKHLSWSPVVNHSTPTLRSALGRLGCSRRSHYKVHLMLMKSLAEAVVVHVSCVIWSLLIQINFLLWWVSRQRWSLLVRVFSPSCKPQYHSQACSEFHNCLSKLLRAEFPLFCHLWPNFSWVKSSIV